MPVLKARDRLPGHLNLHRRGARERVVARSSAPPGPAAETERHGLVFPRLVPWPAYPLMARQRASRQHLLPYLLPASAPFCRICHIRQNALRGLPIRSAPLPRRVPGPLRLSSSPSQQSLSGGKDRPPPRPQGKGGKGGGKAAVEALARTGIKRQGVLGVRPPFRPPCPYRLPCWVLFFTDFHTSTPPPPSARLHRGCNKQAPKPSEFRPFMQKDRTCLTPIGIYHHRYISLHGTYQHAAPRGCCRAGESHPGPPTPRPSWAGTQSRHSKPSRRVRRRACLLGNRNRKRGWRKLGTRGRHWAEPGEGFALPLC